jgi:hypothetical protein
MNQENPYGIIADEASAASRVTIPAIGLIAMAALGLVTQMVAIILNLFGVGAGFLANNAGAVGGVLQGGVWVVYSLLVIVFSAIILVGAFKMKSQTGYGLAMASAFLAAVPCTSPCCCLSMPMGIWAVIVLMDQNVKSSFR